ncbi:MAG: reverse transcriptase/maturase family protein [Nanoarchaeota archaeon]|nr:reverse transcriptase/maturase family protein [Nanoarchaeota archaeon]
MKSHKNLYEQIVSIDNLIRAWRRARKGKTQKDYVIEFEFDTIGNLFQLQKELQNQTYCPKPLKTFILRDPKTRKISKSNFRDRIIHHAIVRIIESIFDKTFIYDSCANRKGKGNLFALDRLKKFMSKISGNGKLIRNKFNDTNFVYGYCLKADIKHYFQEVDHNILISRIKRKIKDEKAIWLIKQILNNISERDGDKLLINKGMPLGNLTSQFFANIYLNKLDSFVKHTLKAKCYIRYVDDFILLHNSKSQLETWKKKIDKFLKAELKLELHPDKSKIIPLAKGIDFVGFRNFYYFKLLRQRNIRQMLSRIKKSNDREELEESFQGWQAYAKWANSFRLTNKIKKHINI